MRAVMTKNNQHQTGRSSKKTEKNYHLFYLRAEFEEIVHSVCRSSNKTYRFVLNPIPKERNQPNQQNFSTDMLRASRIAQNICSGSYQNLFSLAFSYKWLTWKWLHDSCKTTDKSMEKHPQPASCVFCLWEYLNKYF